ncbi:MAG: hypothetical protein LBD24_08325 [Spirochaetaceae bacterium]|nr:hypothetical protein [Spirochaetaceae bacterium]
MHHFEATGGHAETVGDGPEAARERSRALVRTSPLTGHGVAPLRNNSAVPPAPPADTVLHHLEATGGHA